MQAFKDAGGMPVRDKVRMICVSYAVMLVSAIAVQKPFVWIILAAVAVFLLWLVFVRIPTISAEQVAVAREREGAL